MFRVNIREAAKKLLGFGRELWAKCMQAMLSLLEQALQQSSHVSQDDLRKKIKKNMFVKIS